jgi:hypothetical protein
MSTFATEIIIYVHKEGDTMTDKVQDQAQQPAGAEQAEAPAELNISDLNAMKAIIDIASQRGTFKPNEMTVVGQTYTKLTAFLEAVAKQQQEGVKE